MQIKSKVPLKKKKEQAKILEELFDTTKSTPPRDKVLTKLLGSMATGLAAQARQLHQLLQQTDSELKNRSQCISQLKDENKTSREQISALGALISETCSLKSKSMIKT